MDALEASERAYVRGAAVNDEAVAALLRVQTERWLKKRGKV